MRLLLLFCLLLPAFVTAQEKARVPDYTNRTCPMMKSKKAKAEYSITRDGQTVRFCCRRCLGKARQDPEAALRAAYGEIKEVGNERCPVTGRPADEKITVTWQGHRVRLADEKARAAFAKEPRLRLTLALHPELKLHPRTTCPVMEGEKVVDDCFVIWRGHLIRMCCEECQTMFLEDPTPYQSLLKLPKRTAAIGGLDQARAARAKADLQLLKQAVAIHRLVEGRLPLKEEWPTFLTKGSPKHPDPYLDPSRLKDGKLLDPWGREYGFTRGEGATYRIFSLGADGKEGGEGAAADLEITER